MKKEKPVIKLVLADEEIKKLEQDREVLKSFIVRHHPEMEGWIRKNFGRVKQ